LVVIRALEGRDVVRLKGGDPLVFGRGGEEAEELRAARIPFEIVPGISAALAAAAQSNIPLTHREAASSVTFATAHAADEGDVSSTLPLRGTLVLYMGLGRLASTLASLVASGRALDTPAAVVSRASLPDARVVTGTLATLAAKVASARLVAPAVIIVGEVVARAVASEPPLSLPRALLKHTYELGKA
jgi:siroheme synthase